MNSTAYWAGSERRTDRPTTTHGQHPVRMHSGTGRAPDALPGAEVQCPRCAPNDEAPRQTASERRLSFPVRSASVREG
jgi:hypothetical protein